MDRETDDLAKPCPGLNHGGQDQVAGFRVLHTVTRRVHTSLDLPSTLDAVASGVIEATGFGVVVVNLARADGDFEVVSVEGDDDARDTLLGTVEPASRWHALMAASRRWGELRFVHHADDLSWDESMYSWVPDIAGSEDPNQWHPLDALFAPLTAPSGALLGILSVDLPAGGRIPGPDQLELLSLFADHASIAIEHARIYAALQHSRDELAYAATHDALTGLSNRMVLQRRARALAQAPHSYVAAVVLDVDALKALNDSKGHQAGDELLCIVAQRLRGCVRSTDTLVRMGGDEFVVVLGGDDAESAAAATLIARVNAALLEPFRGNTGIHQIEASIGAAVAPTPTDFDQLLAAADADMYRNKRQRRAARCQH
ncbi:MAG: sensor-containing diguanylate cyclase [Pseudonocardiales bacterium]|nr:sensor-containing diguanylate cyclase [Pseudonocardiales bacterium]